MKDDAPSGDPAATSCRYCGSNAAQLEPREQRIEGDVYQVIVLCAACKRPFATIARN